MSSLNFHVKVYLVILMVLSMYMILSVRTSPESSSKYPFQSVERSSKIASFFFDKEALWATNKRKIEASLLDKERTMDDYFELLKAQVSSIKDKGPEMSYTELREASPNRDFTCKSVRKNIASGKMAKPQVNFLAASSGYKYEDFIPLYAFSSLSYNPDIFVEMVVSNVERFQIIHGYSLFFLQRMFGNVLCVREFNIPAMSWEDMDTHPVKGVLRFYEVPQVPSEFVYISDTDFFVASTVMEDTKRMRQMETWSLPYSDVIRPNLDRLTGIILARTDAFFTEEFKKEQIELSGNRDMREKSDEYILYLMCKKVHGLPPVASAEDPLTTYRPHHGFHMSWNRSPGSTVKQKFKWNFFTETLYLKEFLSYSTKTLDILFIFFDHYDKQMKEVVI